MISGLFSLPLASAEAAAGPPSNGSGADEAFIAGPENALVRVLAEAAVADPPAYNPLVLCGPSGVGKTSLAHTLAARRRVRLGLKHVIATSGVDLARGLAHAIETDSVADFRTRLHRCDLLLIDDLHRVAGKGAAQEFLLAALDVLLRRCVLVIATLRKLPPAAEDLPQQLCSRLASGLVVPLAPPGPLARRALVQLAASRVSQPLSDDVQQQLVCDVAARRLVTAPQLRNAVWELSIAADAQHRRVRPAHVSRWLAQHTPQTADLCRRVCTEVGRQTGFSASALKGKSREQAACDARALAMYLVRRLSGATYSAIGRSFSDRDHTTVLHACRKVERLIGQDETLRRLTDELAAQIVAGEGD